MKKGLLTVLLASLVLVGCQNYDDQFDDLNAQISALKSQVDGLSSLSGQVSSLSGTISGLQSGISAATAAATAAGTAATAAGASADANATAIAAATAAATAAGASADAATAAATAATTAATEAVAAGATNATAIAAATAAATAAGVSADAATAAAQAATTAASSAASATDLTALSASLTALAADVAAVQTAIASASTSAEVAALQAEIDAIELDLDNLLTSNNVYATAITVNSAASMASALALGNKVALMNAAVTITDSSTISDTDIQTFIDRIKTMNGTFTYDSGSATGFTPTFDEMVAGTVFAITPAGPLSFKKLASATTVTITTTYSTKITSLDMSALTSLTSFNTGTVNQLHLSSATNVDLGALPRYGTALSIQTKKGATLDIGLLDDVSTAGVLAPMTLTLNGPASISLSKIDDGTITLQNVATATVSGFYGTLDIKGGVETLTTTDSVFIDLDSASDLVTATLDFKADWDPLLSTANAAISAAGYSTTYLEDYAATGDIIAADLKTLTITGDLLDLYLDETNIETLSIDANMTDLTMSAMTDLTTLSVSGKVGSISLLTTPNITVADFNHTSNMENKDSATANKSVSFIVTDNASLTKLHTTGDLIKTFTVTGNDALTELDMTGLKTRGTDATGGSVNLWDNDLTAVKSTDTSDGETNKGDGATGDAGSTDDGASGMDTMKVYLTAIAADALNTAQVNFDTVSTFDDSETTTTATTLNTLGSTSVSATTNDATVLKMTPAVANTAAGAKSAIAQIYGMIITPTAQSNDAGTAAGTLQITTNGVNLFDTSLTGNGTALALNGNQDLDILAIKSAINLSRATSAGVTMDAKRGANSTAAMTLRDVIEGTTTSVLGERYTTAAAVTAANTATNYGMGSDDYITITVGSNSVTATGASATSLASAVYTAWAAKYHSSGTASAAAVATMTSPTIGSGASQALAWTMNQEDSGGYGKTISASVTAGTTTATTAANIDYTIGASNLTSNNTTVDDGVSTILTLTANAADTAVPSVTTAVSAAASMAAIALATTKTTNTAWANGDLTTGAQEPITDVRAKESTVAAATSNAVAAVKFNRVTWLG